MYDFLQHSCHRDCQITEAGAGVSTASLHLDFTESCLGDSLTPELSYEATAPPSDESTRKSKICSSETY